MYGNDENEQFSADDEVTGDSYKLSGNEDDSHSEIRYDRFSTSDEKDYTDKIKVEPVDDNQPMKDTDVQQNVVVKSEPK